MSRPSPDQPTMLRMAVIGCGPIGALHAEAISRSTFATLVAVCDCDGQRREAAARRFGAHAFERVEQLLAAERLDAVTIATPDHLHVEPTLAALSAGCHVFCEKPLATRLEDAERIVAAAARSDMHLGVDYSRRFAFGYRTARQLLDRGSIGKLNYALVRVSDRTPPTEVARHPHVIFTTLLTHHLDLLRWYGGEICRIQAHSGGETGGGLMHSVSLSLTFANRAIGTIVAGYRDGQTRTAEWLELGGESGAIVVEDVTRRVILSLADADRRESFEPNHFTGGDAFYDSLGEHLRTFIEMVAHGQPPPVTGHDGVASLRLAAAAIRSLETGQAIEV